MTDLRIRDYEDSDAEDLNRIAVPAFGQYRDHYQDWPAMQARLSKTSALGATGDVIVAEFHKQFAGAAAYFRTQRSESRILRSALACYPHAGGRSRVSGEKVGRALSRGCIAGAKRDGSPVVARHTSPIMAVALPKYLRMGFVKAYDAPPIFGVAYAVYTKAL